MNGTTMIDATLNPCSADMDRHTYGWPWLNVSTHGKRLIRLHVGRLTLDMYRGRGKVFAAMGGGANGSARYWTLFTPLGSVTWITRKANASHDRPAASASDITVGLIGMAALILLILTGCTTAGFNLPAQTDKIAAKYPGGPEAVAKLRDFLGLHYDDPASWETKLEYFDGEMKPVKGPITRVEKRKRVTTIELPVGKPVFANPGAATNVIPQDIVDLLSALTNAPPVSP